MPKLGKESLIAECVGTFLLVFTVGCNVLGANGTWGAVSIACVLMVSIYAFGSASGANFNPAVSLALGAAKKMDDDWKQVGAYCGAQAAGAVIAALCYSILFGEGFELQPLPGLEFGAVVCEVLYTFMLCFVVLNVAASQRVGGKNQFYGLAIGLVIVAGAYGSSPLGAGCFNPAVALGITVSAGFAGIGWCLLYIAAEVVGAALAVGLFFVVRPEEMPGSGLSPPGPTEKYPMKSALIAEGVGTYMLTVTVGLNVLGFSPAAAFSIAATLSCMIYALGDVSGGHFNPAVTAAIHLSGSSAKMEAKDAGFYVLAQTGAAILGGLTYCLVHGGNTFALGPGVGSGWMAVFMVEYMFTFVLTTVVLCVACRDTPPPASMVGFIIGSCVTAGGFAAGPISGGVLNPGVAAGIAFARIIGGGFFFKALLYGICELLGGLTAASVYKLVYAPGEETTEGKAPMKEEAATA